MGKPMRLLYSYCNSKVTKRIILIFFFISGNICLSHEKIGCNSGYRGNSIKKIIIASFYYTSACSLNNHKMFMKDIVKLFIKPLDDLLISSNKHICKKKNQRYSSVNFYFNYYKK